MVVLDNSTGEVLAMANQPAYNPNDLSGTGYARLRNRAVTDLFEPGSTVKPITIAAALRLGAFSQSKPLIRAGLGPRSGENHQGSQGLRDPELEQDHCEVESDHAAGSGHERG